MLTEQSLTIKFKKKNNMSKATFSILLFGRVRPVNICYAFYGEI